MESYVSYICAFAEPYYDEDLSIPNSPDMSGAERQPSLSNVSGVSDLSSTDNLVREAIFYYICRMTVMEVEKRQEKLINMLI